MLNSLSLFQGEYGRDPRPTRFARFIAAHAKHTVCCYSGEKAATDIGMNYIPLAPRSKGLGSKLARASSLLLKRFEEDIRNTQTNLAFNCLKNGKFNLIFCHDLALLPLACALKELPHHKGKCKIIMDAREYYPRQFENNRIWKFFLADLNDYLCKKYLSKADLVYTVSPGLVKGYKEKYGIDCKLLPSFPYYSEVSPMLPTGKTIRMIHHGAASPGRQLEKMIDVAKILGPDYTLDFMLIPNNPSYLNYLKKLAKNEKNIHFRAPVEMTKIVAEISTYDMGIFLLPPNTFNHRYTLPNKLFEFIQARLAVAIGPSPDMEKVVRENNLGIIAKDFTAESMAETLQALSLSDIKHFKIQSDHAAKKFCWEQNEKDIAQDIEKIF